MAKEKVRLWDRLKYKYKLSVINETSYEEVFNFRLSQLHVLTALSVLAVILVVLTILLIAFTDLREFIPGYPDGNMRQMIAQNALRVDSLENELLKSEALGYNSFHRRKKMIIIVVLFFHSQR